jgi:hypothetical protein
MVWSRGSAMRFSGPLAWCLVALLVSSGCARKRAAVPAPPATIVIPKPKPPKKDPTLPPGPALNTSREPEAKPPEAKIELPPPPPKPAPTKKRRTARRSNSKPPEAPKVTETKPVPAEPKVDPEAAKVEAEAPKPDAPKSEAPAAPAVQLEVILSPEQNRDYTRRIDQALDRAKNAVQLIQAKTLNSTQKETVSRIQSFISQAEQSRSQDLVSSLSLAERADLLSKDLLDRIGR